MTHPRRFRFAVQCSNATSAKDWASKARKAEDLGFSTLFMPDHFGDQLAPVPALMAVADATTTLRIGMLVLDNDYRHPVVLAKEAATLDLLSDGRLELGLGAGWLRTDYEQSGIPYDDPKVRVDRFEEGLKVVKGLLGPAPFSFEGTHYRVKDLDGFPKPVQSPRLPIIVGGGGKRMLGIAAREADIVGVNPNLRAGEVNQDAGRDAVAPSYERKLRWVRDAAGDRFDDIELNVLIFIAMVTDDREGVAANLAGGFGLTQQEALEVPLALVGAEAQIVDELHARRDRYGFSYITLGESAMDDMAPIVAKTSGT